MKRSNLNILPMLVIAGLMSSCGGTGSVTDKLSGNYVGNWSCPESRTGGRIEAELLSDGSIRGVMADSNQPLPYNIIQSSSFFRGNRVVFNVEGENFLIPWIMEGTLVREGNVVSGSLVQSFGGGTNVNYVISMAVPPP